MLPGAAPRTTRVVNLAPPPSTASAARPVTSLVVEAGVASLSPFSDSSTRPATGSATTTDTRGPRAPAASRAATADPNPVPAGSGPVQAPARSAGPARAGRPRPPE